MDPDKGLLFGFKGAQSIAKAAGIRKCGVLKIKIKFQYLN